MNAMEIINKNIFFNSWIIIQLLSKEWRVDVNLTFWLVILIKYTNSFVKTKQIVTKSLNLIVMVDNRGILILTVITQHIHIGKVKGHVTLYA